MGSAVQDTALDKPCESAPIQTSTEAEQKDSSAEGVTCLPFGEAAPVPGALSISADGHTAAHIGINGEVVLWDAVNIKLLETIPADGKKPGAVALSPDGDLVAIGYFDSRVIVRSRREHKLLREFNGHVGGVSALAFSLDGQMLASGGDDATTQLWEVSTGRRLRVFDSRFGGSHDRGGIPVSLGFSGNGRALVVNEWYTRFYDIDRGITLWDIKEGLEISTRNVAPPNTDDALRAGQAMGGGGWLLAYTGNKGLMVERLDLCEPPRQLPSGHFAETVAADPQGRWVAAAEVDKLTFFGMSGDTKGYSITLPSKAIALVAHPDGRSIFALINESALYRIPVPAFLWSLPPMVVKEEANHCQPPDAVRTVQDFRLPEKPVELKVTAKFEPTKEMTTDPENPTGEYNQINPPRELYFSPDGNLYALYIANTNFRSGAAVWNLKTKRLRHSWFKQYVEGHTIRLREGWGAAESTVTDLLTGSPFASISNDDNKNIYVNVTSDPDTGEVYRLMTDHFERYDALGKRLKDVPQSRDIAAFSARNGRLAALYSDGKIQVWPLQAGGESKTFILLPSKEEARKCGGEAFELSGDGNYVQIPCDQGPDALTDYRIYSLNPAKLIAHEVLLAPFPLRANLGVVQDVRPHHLAVWDFQKGEIIARLPRHNSRDKNGTYKPLRAAISDDGRLLASASYDGLVRVWDINTRQVVGEVSIGGTVTAMAFDSFGQQLAAGREDGQLIVLKVSALK